MFLAKVSQVQAALAFAFDSNFEICFRQVEEYSST